MVYVLVKTPQTAKVSNLNLRQYFPHVKLLYFHYCFNDNCVYRSTVITTFIMHMILQPIFSYGRATPVSLHFKPNFILVYTNISFHLLPPFSQHLLSALPSSFIVVESIRTVLLLIINYGVIAAGM